MLFANLFTQYAVLAIARCCSLQIMLFVMFLPGYSSYVFFADTQLLMFTFGCIMQ